MAYEILADAKSLREILNYKKYEIDYYQREYVWQEAQVQQLIEDLTDRFEEDYDRTHDRKEIYKSYNPYFMGSIIVCEPDGTSSSYIIDGQQRLTSFTLLLIFLYHNLTQKDREQVKPLIKSHKAGEFSFNLDIPEREQVMEGLLKNEEIIEGLVDNEESLTNLIERYGNIETHFPENIKNDKDRALPYFTDWLLDKVMMSKITAKSDEDAYAIFETMNDRGVSLTPVEMLKSYLLANIKNKESRDRAKTIWQEEIKALQEYIDKNIAANSIKAWLRGQHAKEIREKRKDATNKDFGLIGTQFHSWVRDKRKSIGLERSEDFSKFIEQDFCFYNRWYRKLYEWAYKYDPEFLAIRSNGYLHFNLQFPAILSALKPQDRQEEIKCKIKVVSTYIDILLARYIWNYKSISESALRYHMFLAVILKIRGKPVDEIAQILTKDLNEREAVPAFDQTQRFYWHGSNRTRIHLFLARITHYIEIQTNDSGRFSEYINDTSPKDNPFEIEHIVGNKPEKYSRDLYDNRDLIGGLLLLPKKVNESIGKVFSYKKKNNVYLKQNILASSLHEDIYSNNKNNKDNDGFNRFVRESNLPFKPYDEFDLEALDQRYYLYLEISNRIWDPRQLTKIAEGEE